MPPLTLSPFLLRGTLRFQVATLRQEYQAISGLCGLACVPRSQTLCYCFIHTISC